MPTALQIVTRAMKICGALGQNETPSSSEADDGLESLNDMLDSWNTDRTFVYSITQTSATIVNGQATYTLGSGGDFNLARPVKIDYAFIRINDVDYELKEINNQDYASIPFKENGEFPQFFYYNPSLPLGTITLYGVPTEGDLYINTWTQITEFATLQTSVTFPPGYRRAVNFNLAKEIATEYGLGMPQDASEVAKEALANIKDRNLPEYVMKTEVGYLTDGANYVGYRGY